MRTIKILHRHYKKIICGIFLCMVILLILSMGLRDNTVCQKISVDLRSDNEYVVEIIDRGYNEELPIKMKLYFSVEDDKATLRKPVAYECERTEKYEYASIAPHINKEDEKVFLSLKIFNVNCYSRSGEFLERVDYEYEIAGRIDLETLVFNLLDN